MGCASTVWCVCDRHLMEWVLAMHTLMQEYSSMWSLSVRSTWKSSWSQRVKKKKGGGASVRRWFTFKYEEKALTKSDVERGVVCHQGGLSSGWSLIRVVSHQDDLSSGWSLTWMVFHQGGLSAGWSFIWVVFHQGGLSLGWSVIWVVSQLDGLSYGWSPGWSLIRVVFSPVFHCLHYGQCFISVNMHFNFKLTAVCEEYWWLLNFAVSIRWGSRT